MLTLAACRPIHTCFTGRCGRCAQDVAPLLSGIILLAPMLSLEKISKKGLNPYLKPVGSLLSAIAPTLPCAKVCVEVFVWVFKELQGFLVLSLTLDSLPGAMQCDQCDMIWGDATRRHVQMCLL